MKKKKRYPTYNELRKIKRKEELENIKLHEEYENRQEIEKIKIIAASCSKALGLEQKDVFNSMGLFRFNL